MLSHSFTETGQFVKAADPEKQTILISVINLHVLANYSAP